MTHCKCGKLRLAARSSTEAELIALSDATSVFLWSQQFLKYQGYDVVAERLEDSMPATSMAKSGRPMSDRTRHVDVKYFFAKQCTDSGRVILKHCPAADMVADTLAKPLQGYQLERLRDFLLGL